MWRKLYWALFNDAPGEAVLSDRDVPVSGIDRMDRFGNRVNWTWVYSTWYDQEDIERNQDKHFEEYVMHIQHQKISKCPLSILPIY